MTTDTVDDPGIPDPLREAFDALERGVAVRRLAEIRARCAHDRTATLQRIGHPDAEVCTDCGKWLPAADHSQEAAS